MYGEGESDNVDTHTCGQAERGVKLGKSLRTSDPENVDIRVPPLLTMNNEKFLQ